MHIIEGESYNSTLLADVLLSFFIKLILSHKYTLQLPFMEG